jgi:hypothetical protein
MAIDSSSIGSPVSNYQDLFNDNRRTMAQQLHVVSSTDLDFDLKLGLSSCSQGPVEIPRNCALMALTSFSGYIIIFKISTCALGILVWRAFEP